MARKRKYKDLKIKALRRPTNHRLQNGDRSRGTNRAAIAAAKKDGNTATDVLYSRIKKTGGSSGPTIIPLIVVQKIHRDNINCNQQVIYVLRQALKKYNEGEARNRGHRAVYDDRKGVIMFKAVKQPVS